MNRMEKQVGTVQNTIHDLGVRTRAINKNLSQVSDTGDMGLFDESNIIPLLAAEGEA
jgi:DNA recombination protein RmuC